MSDNFKFRNVKSGYAEIYFTKKDILTVVEKKRIVESLDLENDAFNYTDLNYTDRWFAYVHNGYSKNRDPYDYRNMNRMYIKIGRNTGYDTRKEAIAALEDYVSNILD